MISKFEISCLVGTHSVVYTSIQTNGNDVSKFDVKKQHKLAVNSRVLQIFDDTKHGFGLILLTDRGPCNLDFAKLFASKLYTFPLHKEGGGDKLSLLAIKMRKVHQLLSSEELESENMINYDCSFAITEANQKMFNHKQAK